MTLVELFSLLEFLVTSLGTPIVAALLVGISLRVVYYLIAVL